MRGVISKENFLSQVNTNCESNCDHEVDACDYIDVESNKPQKCHHPNKKSEKHTTCTCIK